MKNYGFIRTAAAVPALRLADPYSNAEEICRLIDKAVSEEVSLVAFPELALTGATCGDLFSLEKLQKGAEEGLKKIITHCEEKSIAVIVGVPVRHNGRLYNCAAVIKDGILAGLVPKTYGTGRTPFASGSDFAGQDAYCEVLYASASVHGYINIIVQIQQISMEFLKIPRKKGLIHPRSLFVAVLWAFRQQIS